jgi:dTDP-glucose 4,6-dehydratase
MLLNALEGKPLPVYGDGRNVRDWLYVDDHCEALWLILREGRAGETYNIGGECEKQNIEVVQEVCNLLEELRPSRGKRYEQLISFVADRPGHDRRYAIDCGKIRRELGWKQRHDFSSGLRETVAWYLGQEAWIEGVRSGAYQAWIERNYTAR